MSDTLSREEARNSLRRAGKTITAVARELKVHPLIVQQVLKGRLKGERGDAHKVAVALGIKAGVIVDDATPIAEAIRMARAS